MQDRQTSHEEEDPGSAKIPSRERLRGRFVWLFELCFKFCTPLVKAATLSSSSPVKCYKPLRVNRRIAVLSSIGRN
jgi:hypothetical protein